MNKQFESKETSPADRCYFEGMASFLKEDYERAEASLTGAIMANPEDSRYFYLRAMTRMHLAKAAPDKEKGKEWEKEAMNDIKEGAAIEMKQTDRIAADTRIYEAFEKVQVTHPAGIYRIWLEKKRLLEKAHILRDQLKKERKE